MLVKTFQAENMSEAFKLVKAELGPDAMIISSRKDRRKGIFGFFRKPVVEITAALDLTAQKQRTAAYRSTQERERTTKEEFQNSMLEPLVREIKDLRDRVDTIAKRETVRHDESAKAAPPVEKTAVPAQEPRAFPQLPKQEMEELKRLLLNAVNAKEKKISPLHETLRQAKPEQEVQAVQEAEPALPEALLLLEEELKNEGIESGLLKDLLDAVAPAASAGETLEALRGLFKESLLRSVHCTGPLRMRKNGPRILALVGPTGVGKTTTAAKLAASFALRREATKVALITLDNFRVGAIEQLRTYSKIMGIPLEVASTPTELERAIESHGDKDLIIIDTAGRSPKDQEKLDELHAFLGSYATIEIHLCLSATTRDRELKEIVARFGLLPIKRVIFTKLDESESYGCIVNTHFRDKFQLSYFTTGQRVPEDLELASPRKVAELVVKGAHDGSGS